MILYYLKSALKSLRSNSRFTAINIIGFAFGISVCLAIVLYIINEYSYDRYHKNANNIVRIIDAKNNQSLIDYRVKDILTNNYSEIENSCLVLRVPRKIDIRVDNDGYYIDDILSVDNSFFKIFTLDFVYGNATQAFYNLTSAVITESLAKFFFGNENPLGKEIIVLSQFPVTISGVIKDFPETSSFSAGLLVNAENQNFKFMRHIGHSDDLSTYRWPFTIYLQLNEKVDKAQFLNKINSNSDILKPYEEELGFLDLTSCYLHDLTEGSSSKKGNLALLKLLTIIATIILVLAIINYINLTVAQQTKKNKDTGVKKTIGALRGNLLFGFLSESVLVAIISLLGALVFIWLALPLYSQIFQSTLDLSILSQFPFNIILISSILLIGIISGIGPALVLSQVKPIQVLYLAVQ